MIDVEFAGAAIREAIATEREAIADWSARLDKIEAEVNGKAKPKPEPATPPAAPPKRRQKKTNTSTSPVAARKRRDDIYRFLLDQGGEVAPRVVREAMGMSENSFRSAANKLVEEGKLRRKGERQFTIYEAIADPPAPPPAPKPSPRVGESTLQGRILTTLGEIEFGTEDELADLLGETTQTITRECGALIREEEVQMDTRSGRTGYVLAHPA